MVILRRKIVSLSLPLKEMRVLVTGGAGFIGSEVVSQLLTSGSFVTILDNFSSGKKQYLPKSNKKLKSLKEIYVTKSL